MSDEKVVDFDEIKYFVKLDKTMNTDIIPLPDGVTLNPDTWYTIRINKK